MKNSIMKIMAGIGIMLGTITSTVWAVPAYYILNGIKHNGDVSLTFYQQNFCRNIYKGNFIDSNSGEILEAYGSMKFCGWTGPYAVGSYYVKVPEAGSVRLHLLHE